MLYCIIVISSPFIIHIKKVKGRDSRHLAIRRTLQPAAGYNERQRQSEKEINTK